MTPVHLPAENMLAHPEGQTQLRKGLGLYGSRSVTVLFHVHTLLRSSTDAGIAPDGKTSIGLRSRRLVAVAGVEPALTCL